MPKAVYIIGAEAGAEDRVSGRASLFNLIEKISIFKLPDAMMGLTVALPMFISAVWMRSDDDVKKEFESEILIRVPQNEEPTIVAKSEFVFEKPFQRFSIRFHSPLPFKGPGMMFVVNRIRAVGSTEWLSQEYPILVEEFQPSKPSSDSDTSQPA